MKNTSKITLLSLLLGMLFIFSCVKEPLTDPASEPAAEPDQEISHLPPGVEGEYYTATLADFATERSANWVTVDAPSVDALEAAIAGANPGAVIYLKAGTHTLNARLTIAKSLKIIGEEGAELLVTSNSEGTEVDPGIHILDAPHTLIQNVAISTQGEDSGWTGILWENSSGGGLLQSTIDGFRLGVIIEDSDRLAIIGNTFENASEYGLLLNNGQSTYLGNNTFRNVGGISLWVCDKWNTLDGNTFESKLGSGVLLCNWAAWIGYSTPSGELLDADFPSTGCKIRNNIFRDNPDVGLSIRDGSLWNLVEESNEYMDNGNYDIRVPADEDFGWLFIPAALDNTIHAAPNVLIKDCGINTTVVGGTLVDTNVDPC